MKQAKSPVYRVVKAGNNSAVRAIVRSRGQALEWVDKTGARFFPKEAYDVQEFCRGRWVKVQYAVAP